MFADEERAAYTRGNGRSSAPATPRASRAFSQIVGSGASSAAPEDGFGESRSRRNEALGSPSDALIIRLRCSLKAGAPAASSRSSRAGRSRKPKKRRARKNGIGNRTP